MYERVISTAPTQQLRRDAQQHQILVLQLVTIIVKWNTWPLASVTTVNNHSSRVIYVTIQTRVESWIESGKDREE